MLFGLIIIANTDIVFFVLENVLNQELACCLFSDSLTAKDVFYIFKCWEENNNIYWYLEIIQNSSFCVHY